MKISIITATFNSGNTVADTLKSVLAQTYRDYELLVIDGASKDNTMDVVRNFEPLFEGRLRYVSEPDHGIYDAMNKGISMATGDVIGILNSDDFYTSDDVLSCIAWTMRQEAQGTDSGKGVDAVYGDIHYVDDKDLTKCVRYYSSRPFRRWMMRLGFMPAHPSFYCRKEVYERCGCFDTSYRVAADFENLLRLIFVNRIRTRYIAKDFVTMRTGGASSSGWQSHKRIMQDHLKALRKNGVYSNIFILSLRYVYKVLEILRTRLMFR